MPTIIKCNRQFGQKFMIERKTKTMAMLIDLEPVLEVAKMTGFGTPADLIEFLKMQPIVEPKQEWISVKDQPPELGERVFVCGIRGGVNIGKRHFAEIDNIAVLEKSNASRSFTHWMPLPKPPTKKGK